MEFPIPCSFGSSFAQMFEYGVDGSLRAGDAEVAGSFVGALEPPGAWGTRLYSLIATITCRNSLSAIMTPSSSCAAALTFIVTDKRRSGKYDMYDADPSSNP